MRTIGTVACLLLALLAVLVLVRFALLSSRSRTPPAGLGLDDGRLARCPRLPNCVSSLAQGKAHSIAPLHVGGSRSEATARARRAIESMPRSRLVKVEGSYLHAEFTSPLFRFVDDLELLWDEQQEAFLVRSASRVGNSDLGANRRRVEELRRRLAAGVRP